VRATVLTTIAAFWFSACTPTRTRPPLPPGAIEICEPCVGTIGAYRLGVGNIWERDIAGPDGVVARRPAAMVSIWTDATDAGGERHLTVVPGSEVVLGDETYRVIEVDNPPGKPGSIRLQKK